MGLEHPMYLEEGCCTPFQGYLMLFSAQLGGLGGCRVSGLLVRAQDLALGFHGCLSSQEGPLEKE